MPLIKGEISLPGDKSISHRAALFSALYNGKSEFTNFNFNADCTATLNCLRSLGIRWKAEKDRLVVWGKPPVQWESAPSALNALNSGTTARLLSGLLAGIARKNSLTGDDSLKKRPMKRIIEPLRRMGAHIDSNADKLPLKFYPVPQLTGIEYELPVASAQVKSAVLLAGLLADGTTSVTEYKQTRDHTERLLNLPVQTSSDGERRIISSSRKVQVPDISMPIPGDISSAAFFLSAAAALPDSELTITNVSLNPTRTGLLDVLQAMGADVDITIQRKKPEPAGQITIRYAPLKIIELPPPVIPNIIDELPILILLATRAEGRFELSGAEELRYKESDRIKTMVENLRNVGVKVEEKKDGLILDGPQEIKGGSIRTQGDHRIAMSFAIARLFAKGEIIIDDPDCVNVSFPGFWKLLKSVTVYD